MATSPSQRQRAGRALVLAWLLLPASVAHVSADTADETDAGAAEDPTPVGAPTTPPPRPPVWVSGGLHSAFLSDLVDGSWQGLTFGVELKLGYRGSWVRGVGGFVQLDVAHWFGPEATTDDASRPFAAALQVALNVGVGVDVVYFGERMRGAFSVGPSVLLRDNSVGHAGAVGFFVDMRPAGVRVTLPRGATLVIDPLTLTMLMPDLGAIPLLQIEYRTVLAIEFGAHRRSP
jgi:hypothetical protein